MAELESVRELTNRNIVDDRKDRDWDEHIRRVQQDVALKAPRRVPHPSLAGTVRVIGDK
jgi:hypothetical protein